MGEDDVGARLGLAWAFELTRIERLDWLAVAKLPESFAGSDWYVFSARERAALIAAAIRICRLSKSLLGDLSRPA